MSDKFVMYPRNDQRDDLIDMAREKVVGKGNGGTLQKTVIIDIALRFLLANWELVQKHNPNWGEQIPETPRPGRPAKK